jgi:hypothetical protein
MKLYVEHIVILMAKEREARPIIKHLALKRIWRPFRWMWSKKMYRVNRGGATITLVLDTKPMSLGNIVEAIKIFNPDIVINLGTGGRIQYTGARIGDAVIKTGVIKYLSSGNFPAELVHLGNDAQQHLYDISTLANKLGLRLEPNTYEDHHIQATRVDEELVPFINLQIISDYLDNRIVSKQQSEKNIAFAIESLDKKFTMVIDTLIHDGLAAI